MNADGSGLRRLTRNPETTGVVTEGSGSIDFAWSPGR